MDEIRCRAVEPGLMRRHAGPVRLLGIDKRNFRKGYKYVSVVTGLYEGCVLDVVEGRSEKSAENLMNTLADQLDGLQAAAMDVWPAYMNALHTHAWQSFFVHDPFHVNQHLTAAMDTVRKREHRELKADTDESLKGSRWTLLKRKHSEQNAKAFAPLEHKKSKGGQSLESKVTVRPVLEPRKNVGAAEHFVGK